MAVVNNLNDNSTTPHETPGCTNPNNYKKSTAFLDSAASYTLCQENALVKIAEVQERNKVLGTPEAGSSMQTKKTIELNLPKLPKAARKGFTVPNLTNNLVSVAELADAECGTYFHKHGVEIDFEGEIIGRGWRDKPSRLWRISLTSEGGERITPTTNANEYITGSDGIYNIQANAIYECKNKEQLIKYYHASLGSHPKRSLIAAAKAGYLRGCPGLNAKDIQKYIGIEYATEMGHMKQTQKGVRSTHNTSNRGRPKKTQLENERTVAAEEAMQVPTQVEHNATTNAVYMSTMDSDGFICSDQTGMFPRISTRGMKYICIFYIYDSNFIKSVALKSRKKEELLRAYNEVYSFCQQRGFKPKLHKLDNETSKDVEEFIASQQTRIQYTPPDMHRANPAERSIQTWKACMKSTMASVPSDFPIALWCRMIEQVDLSVNIIRKCRQNPLLSAWTAMEGEFHFDATPIAPPGTEMMMHDKPNRRKTWGYNAKKAWYLGPCLRHYRSVRGMLPSTKGERITDTFRFRHHAIDIPNLTPADRILEAAKQLDNAIQQQPKKAPMDEHTAIELLREVLLGEIKQKLPPNSKQRREKAQRTASNEQHEQPTPVKPTIVPTSPSPIPIEQNEQNFNTKEKEDNLPNFIPDDDDDNGNNEHYRARRSKRILRQQRIDDQQEMHRVVLLVGEEKAKIPDLKVDTNRKLSRGYGLANEVLQMSEWAYEDLFAGAVIDEVTGESLEYRDLIKNDKYRDIWATSLANEFGRLAQGIRDIKGTNTIFFIPKEDIPTNRVRDITYCRIVVAYRPQKLEKHRSRLTVGGDRINYPYDVSTPTSALPTIKMLWNSVLSTEGAKFIGIDVANFYLGSPMDRPEYMRIPYHIIPDEIKKKYGLDKLVKDGWIFVRIERGMYGLPQAGLLANNLLAKRLSKAGYYQCQFTPGLWRHVWRPVTFSLVVDDFGVKYKGDCHANHLINTLKKDYEVKIDWKGELFVGIKLVWDYEKRTLDTHVPEYTKQALHKFQHPAPERPQHAPAKAAAIQYGAKVQKTTHDTSPMISAKAIKRIQEVVGTFAWYARACDPTMAATLSSIATRQSKATTNLEEEVKQFLDYCHTHPNAGVRFVASDMLLAMHSDASYLSEPEAKSRAAGHFYMTKRNDESFNNGAIMTISKIIKHVMTSASEAETAALFYNCKAAAPLRATLEEMGHQQGPTQVTTDNSAAQGLIKKTMIPKAAKSYDMRFNFLKCRQAQRQFDIVWRRGKDNRADYHSKRHPIKHYINKRHEYVVEMPRQ